MRSNRWEAFRSNRSRSQLSGHLERLHETHLFELAEKQTKIILADTDFKICELEKKQPTTASKVPNISDYYQKKQFSLTYQISSNEPEDNQTQYTDSLPIFRSRSRSYSPRKNSESSFSSNSSLDSPQRPKKQKIRSHPVSIQSSSDSENTSSLTVTCEQNLSQKKFSSFLDRIETIITGKNNMTKFSFKGSLDGNYNLLVPMKILSLQTSNSIIEFDFKYRSSLFSGIQQYLQKQERLYVQQLKIQEQEQQQRHQQIENQEVTNGSPKKEQKQEKSELPVEADAEDDISQKSNALILLQFETLMKLAFANKDLQFIQLSIPPHTSFLLSRVLSKIHNQKLHLLSEFECLSSGYLPSKELFDQLNKFPLLRKIKLLEVIPSDIASITSFNALLHKVDSFEVNFDEITHEAASLLYFKEHYDKVDISFKIDIITNPAIFDVFLTAVSKIKCVNYLTLTNTFYQQECGIWYGSTFRELKILIKKLELDLALAKQIDYSQYLFFQRFSRICVAGKLKISTVVNQKILESLCSLCSTSQNIGEIDISQKDSLALHSQFLSPLLIKDLQSFYACDYSCILKAWSKVKSSRFHFNSSYCNTNKNNDYYAINLNLNSLSQIIVHETSHTSLIMILKMLFIQLKLNLNNNASMQLSSYRFKIKNADNLNFQVKNLANSKYLEQICRSIAKCQSLKNLTIGASLSQPLLKLIQRDTLQTENADQRYAYFSQLSTLTRLQSISLYLHVDQKMLDSIATLIHNSNSLQEVTFQRSELNQYNLDFSKLLKSLRQSQRLKNAQIITDFQSVAISKIFKKEWKDAMSASFIVPLYLLLKSKKCKLQSIKIDTPISYMKGCVPLQKALLLNRNQTQLIMKKRHSKQERAIILKDIEITKCLENNRLLFHYY